MEFNETLIYVQKIINQNTNALKTLDNQNLRPCYRNEAFYVLGQHIWIRTSLKLRYVLQSKTWHSQKGIYENLPSWNMALCQMVNSYWHIWGDCCFDLQDSLLGLPLTTRGCQLHPKHMNVQAAQCFYSQIFKARHTNSCQRINLLSVSESG